MTLDQEKPTRAFDRTRGRKHRAGIRVALHLLSARLFALFASWALWTGISGAAERGFTCRELSVPMRDGTRLAADLYLPQGGGKFPVLIERTPYGKGGCGNPTAAYYARRGYAVLVQDVRGRHASEGEFYWWRDEGWGERRDGYDTIEWAAAQEWSNGNVGTYGLSYSCFNQYLTAPTRPPHLKAMFCAQSAANLYKDLTYPGGALHMIMPAWLLTYGELAKPLAENFARPGYRGDVPSWQRWYGGKLAAREGLERSFLSPAFKDMIDHPLYDDYWRQFAVDEKWGEIDVPIFHFSGWYDRYPHSATKHFNGIRKYGRSEKARRGQKLMIGPWLHGSRDIMDRVIGDIDFGPEAAIDLNALRLRWFDYHLKGIDNGIMDEPPVRIFVMGANRWRDEEEWPLSRARQTRLYFRSGSGRRDAANGDEAEARPYSLNNGLLLPEPPGDEKPDSFEYDPREPLPSIGGDLFVQPNGARDHRAADARSLTFTTPALERDMEVSGIISVSLYAASSAVDTDFVVTVSDVHPNGYAQILRQNIMRASLYPSFERKNLLEPGKIYRFDFELYPISNLFKKGHRIRISVSSSSFPKWYPNSNTGRDFKDGAEPVIARNTIYHDADHPSHVVLPIIEE